MNESIDQLVKSLDVTGTGLIKYWTNPKLINARKGLINTIIASKMALDNAQNALNNASSYFKRVVAEKALNAFNVRYRLDRAALSKWEALNPPFLKSPPRIPVQKPVVKTVMSGMGFMMPKFNTLLKDVPFPYKRQFNTPMNLLNSTKSVHPLAVNKVKSSIIGLQAADSFQKRVMAEKAYLTAISELRTVEKELNKLEKGMRKPITKSVVVNDDGTLSGFVTASANTMNGLGAHCVNSDFGSSYEDDSLYDLRVDYMQPALYPSETQDHLERELRQEVRNLVNEPEFYYEGEESSEDGSSLSSIDDVVLNTPKETLEDVFNAAKETITNAPPEIVVGVNSGIMPVIDSNNAPKISVAQAMAQVAAKEEAPKTNKPLLIGVAGGIAALLYFNKG